MPEKPDQNLPQYPLLSRARQRVRLMLRGTKQARIETDEALRSSCERLARQTGHADREGADEPERHDRA
jgi:hypothetical protein